MEQFDDWASRRRMELEMLLLQAVPHGGTYTQLEAAIRRSLDDTSRVAGLLTLAASRLVGGDAEVALHGAVAIELWRASTRLDNATLSSARWHGRHESAECRLEHQVAQLASRAHLANAVSTLSSPGIGSAATQLRLVKTISVAIGQASDLAECRRRGSTSPRLSDQRDFELAIIGLQFGAAARLGMDSAGAPGVDEATMTAIDALARNLAVASHVCTEVHGAFRDEAAVRGRESPNLPNQAAIAPYAELPGLSSAQAFLRRLRVRIETQLVAASLQDSALAWLARAQFALLDASDPTAQRSRQPLELAA
jgi:hypothetical protein